MAEARSNNVIELDFSGAPPSVGPSFSHVPAGKYQMVIVELQKKNSRKGSPMIQATLGVAVGPHSGKKIADYFTLPQGAEDSKVGLMRFHALLVATGLKQQTGKAQIPLDKLKGRRLIVEVEDNEMEPTDEYPNKRTVSRPAAYLAVKSAGATTAAPAAVADNGAAEAEALVETAVEDETVTETADVAAPEAATPSADESYADELEAMFED